MRIPLWVWPSGGGRVEEKIRLGLLYIQQGRAPPNRISIPIPSANRAAESPAILEGLFRSSWVLLHSWAHRAPRHTLSWVNEEPQGELGKSSTGSSQIKEGLGG